MKDTYIQPWQTPRQVIGPGGESWALLEHDAYIRELDKLSESGLSDLIRQAYELPVTADELSKKRTGLYKAAGGHSVFAGGLADYAHALLASWHAHQDGSVLESQPHVGPLASLFEESVRQGKLITTSLYRIKPLALTGEGETAPILEAGEHGLLLRGRTTFLADALFADELLVFVQAEGDSTPTTIALVPVNAPRLRFRISELLDYGLTVEYDGVFIPWSRVIVDRHAAYARAWLEHPVAKAVADYQWTYRQQDLLDILTGTAFVVAEQSGRNRDHHVQVVLGEIVQELETVKALLLAAEIGGATSESGVFLPEAVSLQAAKKAAVALLERVFEQARRLGGGLIADNPNLNGTDPAEEDLALAWALYTVGSERAYRRLQHELYAFGDPIQQTFRFFEEYPLETLKSRYNQFWETRKPALTGRE
ncbi:4-hydroxyphenylacetate 3-hydroxylase C-terminal domain-containing protein [Paenibacillus filicis]|uniref:4-hydroxyphenylacetate 3-hydroxylase C-terminal domain-containing protein n=1 Tax=Paenibacillus filicis TaxID=669464 RepID=A0ABU9DTP3_9BACL